MAYTPPTADDITERWPTITTSEDELDALIEEAKLYIDETWNESDYKLAIMYLVAHWTVVGSSKSANQGIIQSESFGPMSRSFAVGKPKPGEEAPSDLATTSYGRHYINLLSRNSGGPLVV
jgi:hypothetical protein